MEKPDLIKLQKLCTIQGEEINIIEKSINYYARIGTVLLNDRYGEKVETIESDEGGRGEKIIRKIYQKWMRENMNYSWATLAACFRDCHLYDLARTIEMHFGLSPPRQSDESE